jgi:UTP--glucose-1-phosphate uridylyltransferase
MPIDLAIVPVASPGPRLLPSTKSQPKEMLPVGCRFARKTVIGQILASGARGGKLLVRRGEG